MRLGADEDVATAFVLDGESGNEVASNLTGASGTVAFREASCTPGARVRVSLRAELVSENGSGGHVTVRGELRARIGAE